MINARCLAAVPGLGGTHAACAVLEAQGAAALARELAKPTRLTTLQLSGHLGVGGGGGRKLARHLTPLRRLRPCGDKRGPFGPQPHKRMLRCGHVELRWCPGVW
jgi:hypothetical protein